MPVLFPPNRCVSIHLFHFVKLFVSSSHCFISLLLYSISTSAWMIHSGLSTLFRMTVCRVASAITADQPESSHKRVEILTRKTAPHYANPPKVEQKRRIKTAVEETPSLRLTHSSRILLPLAFRNATTTFHQHLSSICVASLWHCWISASCSPSNFKDAVDEIQVLRPVPLLLSPIDNPAFMYLWLTGKCWECLSVS